MDFSVPDHIRGLCGDVRALVEVELAPLERVVLTRGFAAALPGLDEVRKKVAARGWLSPHLAREHGGQGLSLTELAHLSEELGRNLLGHYAFNCQAPDAGNMELLAAHGTPAQQARWLRPLARAEIRSCFAMTEPEHAGSNPTTLAATARRDGDAWVIDAHKWFTTGAEGAAFAIVMAVTDPAAAPHQRASQIIVPTDTPGYTLVRNLSVMGEPGSSWASHAEVRLTGCRVPAENIIGKPGQGFALAQERLGPGRIHHCMRWIGICERAFALMCARATSRELGDGERLADKQTVQAWVADSRAEIHAARLMVLEAAWRIEQHGAKAAREHVSMIKFYVAGVLQRVLDRALQVHGALGMTDETPIAWWYRHERAARIYDGPDEVHKAVVARKALEA